MKVFSELDSFLKEPQKSDEDVRKYRDELLFIFFLNGHSYEDFVGSPAPYIMRMVELFSEMKKKEAEASKGKGKDRF